jgi:sirohydrochlorin ferrochelatase
VSDLVLLAHGSPDPRHARDVEVLAERVRRARPERNVSTAYLSHDAPSPRDLVVEPGTPVVIVPVLLAPAHHVRVDVPEAARLIATRTTGRVTAAEALGPHPLVLAGVGQLLRRGGVQPSLSTAVVLCAAGSCDGAAVAMLSATLRGSPPPQGWGAWRAAFLDGGPSVGEVAARLTASHQRVVAVAVVIADGVLRDRIRVAADGAGVELVPGVLAHTGALANLVSLRAGNLEG